MNTTRPFRFLVIIKRLLKETNVVVIILLTILNWCIEIGRPMTPLSPILGFIYMLIMYYRIIYIKSIKKLNGEIALISSTRKNSKLLPYLAKKYKIKNKFYNWKHAINFASKLKNMAFLISGRLSHNRRILNKCVKLNRKIFIEKPIFNKSRSFNFILRNKK